jgi:hypothetical protein
MSAENPIISYSVHRYVFFHFIDRFTFVSEIIVNYSGEYKYCCYLGCNTTWTGTMRPAVTEDLVATIIRLLTRAGDMKRVD